MAFAVLGLQQVGIGGRLSTEARPHQVFHYITADDVATVETANYFNAGAANFTEGTGDIIHAVMVASHATNYVTKTYVVKRTGTTIAIKAEVDAVE